MKIKTKVRSGGLPDNRNGVKIKTKVRSGALTLNHVTIKRG